MFEFCFRELEVSDTFKKCYPFFGVDEDDRNSGRVVEGVCFRTAPVVSEGYVCDPFVSFVRAGVAGRTAEDAACSSVVCGIERFQILSAVGKLRSLMYKAGG